MTSGMTTSSFSTCPHIMAHHSISAKSHWLQKGTKFGLFAISSRLTLDSPGFDSDQLIQSLYWQLNQGLESGVRN